MITQIHTNRNLVGPQVKQKLTTMSLILFFFCVFLSLNPYNSFAQTRTIRGSITDSKTGEALVGAAVYVVETKNGTVADVNGRYNLPLPAGNFTLRYSYTGYENQSIQITDNSSLTQDIKLKTDNVLKEVTVSAVRKDKNVTDLTMGMEKLKMEDIRLLPAIMGEVDIIKTLQLLPGVQSVSETSTGFSVRGSSPDQNLIVLDNTVVYNPSHEMGFFSAFNNDVISGIELYKGHFPSRHGGRLASLLEVKSRDVTPEKFSGTGGIGLISSRLMLEGPLGKKTSWIVAARRTYADLFLVFATDEALRSAILYFYDLNGKLTHRFSEKDKLEFNIYNGSDKMGVSMANFSYGNTASSLTWSHAFSEKSFSKISAHFSDYHYNLSADMNQMDVTWISGIQDWQLRADFHRPISGLWDISYGISGIYHTLNPGKIDMRGMNLQNYEIPENESLEFGAYLSNEQIFTDAFSVKYGLRFSSFHNVGRVRHTYTGWEPTLGSVYKLTEHSSVKANYSHNTQYLQLANNSAAGSPLDVWFSASPRIKPQQVDLVSAGYFHNFNDDMYEASAEIYYKDMKNVVDFREHSNLLLNQSLEDEVRIGTGEAYGIEWMLRKNSGKLTGFVNYTLSRSERTIADVNQGKTYLAPFDKTHAVNVVATYNFSKKIYASAVWVYATGMPTTYPTGRFQVGEEYFPLYSGRNQYRRPDYHRLDLSLTYIPKPESTKRWKGEWNFSFYNAYNHKNPWSIMYQQNEKTGIPYAEMIYLFGIVPSITYNFKF
ncbi:collagen-binding protein [Bacteroidia bacterium]|nr:collagen-binding protein [Bacteroidia bacterium]